MRDTVIIWAITLAVLGAIKLFFGLGVSFVVALACLSFCIGALWGAGGAIKKGEP